MATKHETWAIVNPRHAWALEEMGEGAFKGSLTTQLEIQGTLSPKQMLVLWDKAEELELLALGETRVPKVHQRVAVAARITRAAEVDHTSPFTYRVEFTTDLGWRGRFDILTDMKLVEDISTRAADQVRLTGQVVWVRESFVILKTDHVGVELG